MPPDEPSAGPEVTPEPAESETASDLPADSTLPSENVLTLPMDTIVGHRRGRVETHGQDEVYIGPGIVTHPATLPPPDNVEPASK
jgi:hypothetical protein